MRDSIKDISVAIEESNDIRVSYSDSGMLLFIDGNPYKEIDAQNDFESPDRFINFRGSEDLVYALNDALDLNMDRLKASLLQRNIIRTFRSHEQVTLFTYLLTSEKLRRHPAFIGLSTIVGSLGSNAEDLKRFVDILNWVERCLSSDWYDGALLLKKVYFGSCDLCFERDLVQNSW